MSRLSDQHLKSIDRTLTIMRIHRNRQRVPKYQKELDRDIKHLVEIIEHVREAINFPMFDQLVDAACELQI